MTWTLEELQRRMKAAIRAGPPARPSTSAPAGGASAGMAEVLNPQRGTPGAERLAVYADGYLARTQEALAEVYEAVRHVLGEAAFAKLAEAYAAAHPSKDTNLSLSGRHLPEFLAGWPKTAELPFLPDLALLEWAVCQAFNAFDGRPVDAARLAGLAPEAWSGLRLTLQPSAQVLASQWPVLDLWSARKQPRETIDVRILGRPQQVLVSRTGTQVSVEELNEPQLMLLWALKSGASLGEACERLESRGDVGEGDVTAWFAAWVGRGLIADFKSER